MLTISFGDGERRMELRQLRYFVEVVRRGGFTRASEALHVTQPAISSMIKAMEDELGVPLLVRERRRVTPTEAGRIAFERAEALLDSLDRMQGEIAELATLRRGRLRIGLPPMVGAAFFPEILAEYRRMYPGIALELREEGARRIEALVLERELDVGATVLPTDEAAFGTFPFASDVLWALLPCDHPLARAREVRLAELADTPFILHRPEFAVRGHVLDACRAAGFQPRIASESSQWDFIVSMVVAGLGVALLPETICRQADLRAVARLRLSPVISWDLALIWRRDRYLSSAAKAWLELTQLRLAKDAPRTSPGASPSPRRAR